jgi:hypothetical protein
LPSLANFTGVVKSQAAPLVILWQVRTAVMLHASPGTTAANWPMGDDIPARDETLAANAATEPCRLDAQESRKPFDRTPFRLAPGQVNNPTHRDWQATFEVFAAKTGR